jgi:hypothetical protein
MRWLWLAVGITVSGCATAAAPGAPVYFCYGTLDGDGDKLMICEPHSQDGYQPVYTPKKSPASQPATPPRPLLKPDA